MTLPGNPSTGQSIMVAVHGKATRHFSVIFWSSASCALSQPDRPLSITTSFMSLNHAHNQVAMFRPVSEARGTLIYVP